MLPLCSLVPSAASRKISSAALGERETDRQKQTDTDRQTHAHKTEKADQSNNNSL